MLTPHSFSMLVSAVLGFILSIPSNTCIVIVHLESIRKKEKMSPSDVIFLAKAIVNILHQCLLTLQGMLFVFSLYIITYEGELYIFVKVSSFFLTYFRIWLTAWLSAHYCTSITNLRYGFFIWIKRIVSNFLSRILFLTALGIYLLSTLGIWALDAESKSCDNSTEVFITSDSFHINYSYFVPVTFLGCVLPFCLSLLCLLLTFSFLVRHVWRVKKNDSGSSRPNLQAHVTALRTIFFLLLIFTFTCLSQLVLLIQKPQKITDSIAITSWTLLSLSPWLEAIVIFQASNKLKTLILRIFWTKRNTET